MEFCTRLVSSLVKVFPDEELTAAASRHGSALQGEVFSFQVAYRSETMLHRMRITVDSPLREQVRLRRVGLAPVEYLAPGFDADVLRRTPGLYPDPLNDFEAEAVKVIPGQWQAIWVTVKVAEDCSGGEYPVKVTFAWNDEAGNAFNFVETFRLEVLPVRLPRQRLIHTEWFHVDCLSTYYGVAVWSDRHWEIIENYLRSAADHGINLILTPLFTPPLDTAVGGERPTVQLVDVSRDGDAYRFGFARLDRWLDTARRAGIEYFEMSHLFTQWGAAHAPKIVAVVDGEERRLFGWDTDSTGPEYTAFLDAFLPELVTWIRRHGLERQVFFHVSDEPYQDHLETYGRCAALLQRHLAEFPVIDALSNVAFYRSGMVRRPIPCSNHIEPFVEAAVPELWTYYCCSQWDEVSNRFMHLPSSRNRIIGVLLYRYKIVGFLHWGFNFWYAQYSTRPVDPWRTVDAGHAFPPGDAFQVYPGPDGRPVDSIRYEVFTAGLQDLRVLQLLEEKMGRTALVEWLEREAGGRLTMRDYPRGEAAVLGLRDRLNSLVRKYYLS